MNKKIEKKNISLTYTIALGLLLIFAVAYAIVGISISLDSSSISANIGKRPVLTYNSTDNIEFGDIPYLPIEVEEEYVLASDSADLLLSITAGSDIVCSYDIVYLWDNVDTVYTKTNEATKEFTISGRTDTMSFDEVQIADKTAGSTGKTVLYSGVINALADKITTQKWSFTANFYKTKAVQTNIAGLEISGKLSVDNVVCSVPNALSNKIYNLASSDEYTSSQDGTPYVVKQETAVDSSTSTSYDAGIRYEGADPDNYVTYNDELWRIIGVFEGSTIGLEEGKYYTKIVNTNSLGGNPMAYSTDTALSWINASSKLALNSDYLNKIGDYSSTGLSETSRKMIAKYNGNYSSWYLGSGPFNGTKANRVTASEFFVYEKNSNNLAYDKTLDISAYAPSQINEAVGIISISDWGYAMYAGTNNESCSNTVQVQNYSSSSGCYEYNWVHDINLPWMITSYTNNLSNLAYFVTGTGSISFQSVSTNSGISIYPTLYLSNEVLISSGNGSEDNPYKLLVPSRTLSEAILSDNTPYADNVASPNVSASTGINFGAAAGVGNGLGLYYTSANTENDETTYYFRGNVDNNYVKFGKTSEANDIIWRIVRINEDGSVRLITDESVGASQFNIDGDNAYVGYMYGLPETTTLFGNVREPNALITSRDVSAVKAHIKGTIALTPKEIMLADMDRDGVLSLDDADMIAARMTSSNSYTLDRFTSQQRYDYTHANLDNSTIKTYLDDWYINKTNLSNYIDSYLADAGFCNDRSTADSSGSWNANDTSLGYAENQTYYGAYNRLTNLKQPQFKCANASNDLFTLTSATKGNKALAYPVGLITADELNYAGVVSENNSETSYFNNVNYMTMTPAFYHNNGDTPSGNMYALYGGGYLTSEYIIVEDPVYPVINVKGDIFVTGSGIADDPYVIVTN